MSDIPSTIRVGSVTFRVTIDPDDWLRIEHKNLSNGNYGYTGFHEATMYINPESTPDTQRLTLWHEVMHALCEVAMGSPNWHHLGKEKSDREEAVVRAFESPTLLVLRDNPELVAYLTRKATP